MLNRYHINEKGNPGKCKAQRACPFGGVTEHFKSEREARSAYEEAMATGTFKNISVQIPMPERQWEFQDAIKSTNELKAGDKVIHKGIFKVINGVSTGYKYTYLHLEDGTKYQVRPTENHAAQVREETVDSVATRASVQDENINRMAANGYSPQREDVVERINKKVEGGERLTYVDINQLTKAEAADAVMDTYIATIRDVQKNHPDEPHPYSRARDFMNQAIQARLINLQEDDEVFFTELADNFERARAAAEAKFYKYGPERL